MQVVARARAAGVTCRPRDIFVEQTVARLAQVAGVATDSGPADDGIGEVTPTPIMRWLHTVDGPTDQFNQTVVVQAPTGATHTDVQTVLQALLDRHATLRLHAAPDGSSLHVPGIGVVDAADCLHTVDELSEEALTAARSRLNPATGAMVSALWAADTGQLALIIHHLAVDAVSWRILLEDLNIAWAQHHNGQPITLPIIGNILRHLGLTSGRTRTGAVRGGSGRPLEAGDGRTVLAAGGAARCRHLRQRRTTARHHSMSRPRVSCSVTSQRRSTPGSRTSC